VPREAQRVLITSELTAATEKLAEAHARKALHVPARPAVPDEAKSVESVTVEYRVLGGAQARQALAEAIAQAGQQSIVVYCRRQLDCDRLSQEFVLRGLHAETRLYGASTRAGESALGWGAPFDAESLVGAFGQGGTVILDVSQLAHLRNIAKQGRLGLRAAAVREPIDVSGLDRFRDTIRRALQEEDVEAQLLVLEPLLTEFSAAEVAAAASALLRKRAPARSAMAVPAEPAASKPPAFAKLFLSVGQRDAISARELVGAITGEAGVSGEQVGRIEIRDTFSIVEVAAEVAERVIRALNGTSLRGRSLRVDFDRKAGPTRRTMPARRTHPRQ
jgi:ATP-dependent RNA helicase DeaD